MRPMLAAAAWVRMDIPPPARRLEGKQALMAAASQRRRLVESTQGYVNEIKAGVPLGELLAHATPEMRPVLMAAWRMHTTPPPAPDAETFAAGKQMLMAMAARNRAQQRAARPVAETVRAGMSGVWRGLAPRPSLARRAWSGALAALATVAIVGAGTIGVTTAAAASLPGDAFYGVKRLGESARVWLAFDPARKAELRSALEAERSTEISRLVNERGPISADMLGAWLRGQPGAIGKIRRLPPAAQARLGDQVRELLGGGVAVESLVDSPDVARDLLDWLGTLAREAAAKRAAPADTGVDANAALPLEMAPRPIERPLPPDDRAARALRPMPVPLNPAAAGVGTPHGVETIDLSQTPSMFPQGGLRPRERDGRENDRGDRPAASGAPAPQATATAWQIIQVPMPPPTATPTTEPGGGNGGAPRPTDPSAQPLPPEPQPSQP